MFIQPWADVVVGSIQEVWTTVIGFLPLLLGAILVFLIGWIIAAALAKVIEEVARALRVDQVLTKLDCTNHLNAQDGNSMLECFLVRW